LRGGDLIAGVGGIVLLATVLFVPWFAAPTSRPGVVVARDGWRALSTTRWVLLLVILLALALVLLTATRRAPAVPVALAMLSWVLGALAALMLLYRVIHHPGLSARAGIYVGLVATLAIAYGGYRSLRTEGGSLEDTRAIETVTTDSSAVVTPGRTEPTSAGGRGP
jgi:hypothetical protein